VELRVGVIIKSGLSVNEIYDKTNRFGYFGCCIG